MLEVGKMEEIWTEMKRCNIEILALQEIRWKGQRRLHKETNALLYAGEDKQGFHGTAFMIGKTLKDMKEL